MSGSNVFALSDITSRLQNGSKRISVSPASLASSASASSSCSNTPSSDENDFRAMNAIVLSSSGGSSNTSHRGRKRKAEVMQCSEELDCLVVSSDENSPSVSLSSSVGSVKSRNPLSTLQSKVGQSVPIRTFSVVQHEETIKVPKPPQTKRLKMRHSWSQFREFSQLNVQYPGRCSTPFPQLKWADRQEIWDLICKKERGMYRKKPAQEILARHPSLLPRMRSILLDWLSEVCEVYKQHRETFYLAVDFIDRYLSVTSGIPKSRLQLIGVTCLFIASKIEEIYPPKLSEFAYVTDGACNEEDILTAELVILKELNWGLSPMTPNAWVKVFMQVANCDNRPDVEGNFTVPQYSGLPFSRIMQLLDLATLDMTSLTFTNSVIATASLCHLQNPELALAVSGYQWKDVSACVEWMLPFVHAIRDEPPLQPRSFPSIPVDNQHNIQSHTVDVSTLDRVHEKAQTVALTLKGIAQTEDSPIKATDITPPLDDPMEDEKSPFSSSLTTPKTTSLIMTSPANSVLVNSRTATWRQNLPNSIVMSPSTPGNQHGMTLCFTQKDLLKR